MKNRISLIGVAVGTVALMAAFEYSRAQQPAAAPAASSCKIGVVSLSGVFNKSQAQVAYTKQMNANDAKNRADLEALSKQVDAEEAELKTLKSGSADYFKQMQSYLQKRSELDYRQELLKQQRPMEYRQWFEKFYPEVLKTVAAVAQEKKLDLVLERTEPVLANARSVDDLMTMAGTYKVLYADGCVDLTDEVVARLDAALKP